MLQVGKIYKLEEGISGGIGEESIPEDRLVRITSLYRTMDGGYGTFINNSRFEWVFMEDWLEEISEKQQQGPEVQVQKRAIRLIRR